MNVYIISMTHFLGIRGSYQRIVTISYI